MQTDLGHREIARDLPEPLETRGQWHLGTRALPATSLSIASLVAFVVVAVVLLHDANRRALFELPFHAAWLAWPSALAALYVGWRASFRPRRHLSRWWVLVLLASPALAETRLPILVALVIDTSGSLTQDHLEKTHILALDLVRELPRGSEIVVYSFDDQARRILDSTADRLQIEATIRNLRAEGQHTVLYDALLMTARYLEQRAESRKAIVIVSDGKDENSQVKLDDSLTEELRRSKIPIFAIGVGRVNEQVLDRISFVTQGDYDLIENVDGSQLSKSIEDAVSAATPPLPPVPSPEPKPEDREKIETEDIEDDVENPTKLERLPWLIAFTALVVIGLAFVLLRLWRKQVEPALCPGCGNALPISGDPCPICHSSVLPLPLVVPNAAEPVEARSDAITRTRLLHVKEARLTIVQGPGVGHTFNLDLKSPTVVGRGAGVTLSLNDEAVSQKHCQIDFIQAAFTIKDLGSRNGTFKNGQNIANQIELLENGDRLQVGNTALELRIVDQ